jgi:serine/threonine protein kinase
MMMPPGSLIAGRYAVQSQLGQGAQGEVYVVVDTHEHDTVALKLLRAFPSGGPWQEARILRRLADPHILPIRNADLAAGQPYLVTELAMHGTLDPRLTAAGSRGLETDDVVRWIRQACNGVERAHDLRLLHNDMKPANMFLNAQGECLVGDFGCCSLLPPGSTSAWPPCATAETVAPEIAAQWGAAAATASFASDVYSLGATAFWLLAGRPAHDFTGAADIPAKMAIVAATTPVPLQDVAPHVPAYISHAVERAMARNPADRFPSVTAFAAALGARPALPRRWRRTNEHATHIGCWRGEPAAGQSGSNYVLCLEQGPGPRRVTITTRHASSGRRIGVGCRITRRRVWGQAVRAIIRRLG